MLITAMASIDTALAKTTSVRIATFNASLEGGNYVDEGEQPSGAELFANLDDGQHPQIRNIAEIIQRVRPDIILINEFDYTDNPSQGVKPFLTNYLGVGQNGCSAISYPYHFVAPVNTGVPTRFDLNRDGLKSFSGEDAFGFGFYPGQYGMLILSRFPLNAEQARTFQTFLWKDMPGNSMAEIQTADGKPWYSAAARQQMRLSSKSHWDVPVKINDQTLHLLASHPTPPVFDGEENRNGYRNHDEIRFWVDYLSDEQGSYIYDDKGSRGAFQGQRFVLLGDLNASVVEGDAFTKPLHRLLSHETVAQHPAPVSAGGREHSPDNPYAASHTAAWRMRADYVLVSKKGLQLTDSGVFWPLQGSPMHALVASRSASSDHRLVWVDVKITPIEPD